MSLPHAAVRPPAGVQPRESTGTERAVADRERLRQHLICSGLLELAGLAYTVAYFGYGLHGFAWIVVGCMVIGAIAPVFALRGDLAMSAHFATGSLFLVIISTSYGSGGITQAGYAWVYVVPLIAGLLGGVRCLAIWGPLTLIATLTMSLRRHRALPRLHGHPGSVHARRRASSTSS